jgi:hypothetical protein
MPPSFSLISAELTNSKTRPVTVSKYYSITNETNGPVQQQTSLKRECHVPCHIIQVLSHVLHHRSTIPTKTNQEDMYVNGVHYQKNTKIEQEQTDWRRSTAALARNSGCLLSTKLNH